MTPKLYYKVVTEGLDGNLFSYTMECGTFCKYAKNTWTKRPENCGPLAVFNNIKTAVNFLINDSRDGKIKIKYHIYKCYIHESKDTYLWDRDIQWHTRLPPGTVLADKVKLLEEVEIKRS